MNKVPWVFPAPQPKFVLPRLKFTIPTTVPTNLIFFLVYVGVFYVFIGGVYDLVNNPIAIGVVGNTPLLISNQGVGSQFLLEGIVGGLVMFLGSFGLYLIRQASSNPHDTENANRLFILGVLTLLLSIIFIYSMYMAKTSGRLY